MNSNDVIVEIIEETKMAEKAIIIQALYRGRRNRKKISKLRKTVSKVINCSDSIRITPAKFDMPLYITQQTCAKKYCGKKVSKNIEFLYEESSFLYIIFILWLFAIIICSYLFYNNNASLLYYVITNICSLPLFISYFMIIQDKMLKLLFGNLECKLHITLSLLVCVLFTDIFRDRRCILLWTFILPNSLLITFIDALPRYLIRTKRLLVIISFIFFICDALLITYIALGHIDINIRNIVFISDIEKNNIINSTLSNGNSTITTLSKEKIRIVFSNLSYGISILQSIMVLILKNVIWYYRNPHRAVILASPVLITGIGKWEIPIIKRTMIMKFFPMKKIIVKERKHRLFTEK